MTAPTGSGKTWIQGLIAKYYCLNGQRVTVVEPNQTLRLQTTEKLSQVDPGINVLSVEQLYQYGTQNNIVIIDEYDALIQDHPYMVAQSKLNGLWCLKDKQVIAFSATSSLAHERLIHNCIIPPMVLKFKSEYELIHGTSPVQYPNIVICKDEEELYRTLATDIEAKYDGKPIIVIHGKHQ